MESRRFNVNGQSMYVRCPAEPLPATAPAVVLVHGLVVSSLYMVPTIERLGPDFRAYAPDLPGFGEGDKPLRALNLDDMADILADWMAVAGIGRAILMGNSMGCQIIARFVLRHPERAERIVFQGPTVDRHTRTFPQQFFRLLLDSPLERPSQALIMLRDYWSAEVLRSVQTVRIVLEDRIEERLPHIHMPALVVRGSRDPIVP